MNLALSAAIRLLACIGGFILLFSAPGFARIPQHAAPDLVLQATVVALLAGGFVALIGVGMIWWAFFHRD